jgi:N6-adenosine-specific RNA methylase IME4
LKKRYKVVNADPPWKFRNQGNRSSPAYQGHYEPMTVDQIMALGAFVQGVCRPDAALFLWTPASILLDGDATAVCRAWGFEPKQIVPWEKTTADGERPAIGMGNYTRVCAEYMILAVRRRPPVLDHGVPGVIRSPRRRHSEKPPESYQLIERLFDGPYLEMFARRKYSTAWDVWGDQC